MLHLARLGVPVPDDPVCREVMSQCVVTSSGVDDSGIEFSIEMGAIVHKRWIRIGYYLPKRQTTPGAIPQHGNPVTKKMWYTSGRQLLRIFVLKTAVVAVVSPRAFK